MCNINTKEIAYRRKAMWAGIAVTTILFVLLTAIHSPWWLGVTILFVPVYIAAIGYLQVRNKFCVSYGASGLQNADEDGTDAQEVTDDSARKADKSKTRTMNLQAFATTIVIVCAAAAFLAVF